MTGCAWRGLLGCGDCEDGGYGSESDGVMVSDARDRAGDDLCHVPVRSESGSELCWLHCTTRLRLGIG